MTADFGESMLNLTPKMILFVLPSILVTVLENLLVTYIVFVFGFTVTTKWTRICSNFC